MFFKENIDVTISSTDAASGVESVKYFRSDKILTQDELNAVSTWEDYNGTITETAADTQKFVYYVKITDNAGNVNLFGSDGVTFDTTAPVITGIEDGKAYKPNTEVTVSDATDVTVTLNGNSTTLQDDKFSLTGQTGNARIAKQYEGELSEYAKKVASGNDNGKFKRLQKELDKLKQRDSELDTIIKKLFEHSFCQG